MSLELTGVIPALTTPFTAGGRDVDEETLADLVERCIAGGVDGLLTCGGTGEFTTLSTQERQRVVRVVVEQAAGRVPVIAQTGGLSTSEAVEYSEHAVAAGAAALMPGLPFYEPLSEGQVITYLAAVADRVDVDLMFYNYPLATGFPLTPHFLRRLVNEVPAVRYLKDSSGDFSSMVAAMAVNPGVKFFAGSDVLSGPAYLAGAAGVVNGCANVFPEQFATLHRAAMARDGGAVTEIWLRLLPLLSFVETHPFVSSVKHALAVRGLPVGPVRAPLDELDPSAADELRLLVTSLDPSAPAATAGAREGASR